MDIPPWFAEFRSAGRILFYAGLALLLLGLIGPRFHAPLLAAKRLLVGLGLVLIGVVLIAGVFAAYLAYQTAVTHATQ